MNQDVVQGYGKRVGYDADQLASIGPEDPRRRHIQRLAQAGPRYSIVGRVIKARHCNSGYQVGDRLVLDADGNFLAKLCPKRICVYLAAQLMVPVALINERFSEGLDPNRFHFVRQVRCPDVGVECGGYGEVTLEVSAVDRSEVS